MTDVLVEIYSDIVCPWCYIGQHQFAQALEQSPYGDTIETKWRAFQLDPRAPAAPVSLFAAYTKKNWGELITELVAVIVVGWFVWFPDSAMATIKAIIKGIVG